MSFVRRSGQYGRSGVGVMGTRIFIAYPKHGFIALGVAARSNVANLKSTALGKHRLSITSCLRSRLYPRLVNHSTRHVRSV